MIFRNLKFYQTNLWIGAQLLYLHCIYNKDILSDNLAIIEYFAYKLLSWVFMYLILYVPTVSHTR